MKTLSLHIKNKSLAQEAINCWLRYTLSQPISIDIAILGIFAIQYFGLNKIQFVWDHLQRVLSSAHRIIAERLPQTAIPSYGLEQACVTR